VTAAIGARDIEVEIKPPGGALPVVFEPVVEMQHRRAMIALALRTVQNM